MNHGLFRVKQNYSSVGKAISDNPKRDLIAIDMRNRGEPEHAFPLDYITMANDTAEFLKKK